MTKPALIVFQIAAIGAACLRGVSEFAHLQGWRLRERLARRG